MCADNNDRDQWFRLLQQHAGESDKSWGIAFCLSLFLGLLGADRFYLGYGVLGMLKCCSLGGLGLWWVLDVILLASGTMKDSNGGLVRGPFRR